MNEPSKRAVGSAPGSSPPETRNKTPKSKAVEGSGEGSSLDRKEQENVIGECREIFPEAASSSLNQLLLIHLQAPWPSLGCLGVSGRG